mgnify:CR=1
MNLIIMINIQQTNKIGIVSFYSAPYKAKNLKTQVFSTYAYIYLMDNSPSVLIFITD